MMDAMSRIDLSHFVRVYDNSLDPGLCEGLVASFRNAGRFQIPNGRGHRPGLEGSAWTEISINRLSEPSLLGYFRRHISVALDRYNRDIELPIAVPDSPKTSDLVLKRYRAGTDERFQVHFDSINEVCNRYLVFLWYLNDVQAGGETRFPQLKLSIPARRGSLLMFPPYWLYQHEGLPPLSEDKYILSTYLLF